MASLPLTGSNARSIAMQLTQAAYGGCWKCPHAWQRCSASTPRLAASQKGFVHSFGTGIGLVTLLQSLIVMVSPLRSGPTTQPREPGCWPPAAKSRALAIKLDGVKNLLYGVKSGREDRPVIIEQRHHSRSGYDGFALRPTSVSHRRW